MRYDTWNVGIVTLDREVTHLDQLRCLPPPRWLPPQPPLYYVADPFPYRDGDRDWLLVEDYGHPKGVVGRIARVDVDAESPTLEPVIAMPTHISYPYTLECEGRTYCAPEMGASAGCILYRLDRATGWTPAHHILKDRRLIDPTFFRHGGRWWLFATDATGGGSLALHAFHADAIDQPWTPHQQNPIKVDRTSARPAGRPFRIADQLYRPSQDCSRTYGGAVNVMAIDDLTPATFREHVALRLEADPAWPFPDGFHTLVIDGRRIYVDAKRTQSDGWHWLKVWLNRRRRPAPDRTREREISGSATRR
jgi:hypothetical protein